MRVQAAFLLPGRRPEARPSDLLLKLTHLPLAIVQAAGYINENQISLSEYATLLDDTEQNIIDILSEEFEDEGRYEDIKNPIATTWLKTLEHFEYVVVCILLV